VAGKDCITGHNLLHLSVTCGQCEIKLFSQMIIFHVTLLGGGLEKGKMDYIIK